LEFIGFKMLKCLQIPFYSVTLHSNTTYRPLSTWSLNSLWFLQYGIQFYGSTAQARVILHTQEDCWECAGAPYSTARGGVIYTCWNWFKFGTRRFQNYFH